LKRSARPRSGSLDIFSGQGSWHTRRLLDLAKTLNDEQLDRPLNNQIHVFPWDGPDQSLRQLLERMVQTKEAWAAALTGGSTPLVDNARPEDRTSSAMLARLEKADRAFHSVLTDVPNRSAWEDTFVDALCEPPETFSFGGMFAHVITFNAYRRMVAIDVLRGLGVKVEGVGCPTAALLAVATAVALWAPWRATRPVERPVVRLDMDLGPEIFLPACSRAGRPSERDH
jgi:AraC family transcriptional regulator